MSGKLLEQNEPGTRAFGLQTAKPVQFQVGIAPVAGGNISPAVAIGTAISPNIYTGSGAPTISAAQGSLYLRSDGSSTSTRMYVNQNGSTTWTAVTTAA